MDFVYIRPEQVTVEHTGTGGMLFSYIHLSKKYIWNLDRPFPLHLNFVRAVVAVHLMAIINGIDLSLLLEVPGLTYDVFNLIDGNGEIEDVIDGN